MEELKDEEDTEAEDMALAKKMQEEEEEAYRKSVEDWQKNEMVSRFSDMSIQNIDRDEIIESKNEADHADYKH